MRVVASLACHVDSWKKTIHERCLAAYPLSSFRKASLHGGNLPSENNSWKDEVAISSQDEWFEIDAPGSQPPVVMKVSGNWRVLKFQ